MIPRAVRCLPLLLLAGPALAAERPIPTPEAPAARPCPRFGPGFVRVEGGDACVRLKGRVRAEAGASARRGSPATLADGPSRAALGASGRLDIDARTETDYGPARTFVRIGGGRRFPQ